MSMKQCRGCLKSKPVDDFYTHPKMGDGRLNFCKDCVKDRIRIHRRENDHVREAERRRYASDPKVKTRVARTSSAWRRRHPERVAAHNAVARAVRSGLLVKKPCEECGDIRVHAHHDDYTKKLDIRWLCAKHHASIR